LDCGRQKNTDLLPWVKGLGPGSEIWIWILRDLASFQGFTDWTLESKTLPWVKGLGPGSEIWIWILRDFSDWSPHLAFWVKGLGPGSEIWIWILRDLASFQGFSDWSPKPCLG
jgi:hypothetical protein